MQARTPDPQIAKNAASRGRGINEDKDRAKMGLFDTLEQAAGLTGDPSGAAPPQGAVGAVVQMLQSQPGGVAGVIQKFEQSGLGGVAQSWIGAGPNQPVAPGQVQDALGSGAIGQVAGQLGVSQGEAAGHIAQFLPLILDHLSPNGHPPPAGGGRRGRTAIPAEPLRRRRPSRPIDVEARFGLGPHVRRGGAGSDLLYESNAAQAAALRLAPGWP